MTFSPTEAALPRSDADLPTLVEAWEGAVLALHAAASDSDPADWLAPTECPGWTVADLVAHTVAIECDLAGQPDPPHEPAWDTLPHVGADAFARYTETGVDLRRGRTRAVLLDELAAITAVRLTQLRAASQDPDAEVRGLAGAPTAATRLLSMRCFDVWVHLQDLHRATGSQGDLDSAAAWVTAGRLVTSLNYVVGKAAAAPRGSSLRLTVTGPVSFRRTVRVGDDGRSGFVPPDTLPGAPGTPDGPTAAITTDWVTYERLACGRVAPSDPAVIARLALAGDEALARRVVDRLAVTP